MTLRTARYTNFEGEEFQVVYDADAPCASCGLPVVSASVGGTAICPWCDCGNKRDGTKYSFREIMEISARHRRGIEYPAAPFVGHALLAAELCPEEQEEPAA